ncbi:MAG: adenine phosphoribosyltransferase [Clostridia bacterium]|nr:adenine phosphoribosyltransferase [Clostridia bacterium]
MEKFYEVDICNRKEKLPILTLPSGINIAFFNLHGNSDLTEYCGKLLAEKMTGCDVLITAESKGLQLAHVCAREMNMPFYAVARKSKKLYMQDGISVSYGSSITTGVPQQLFLSKHDVDLIKGKKVGIIDDVISTGESLIGLTELVKKAGGIIYKKGFVLAEGDSKNRPDIEYLGVISLL